MIGLDAGVGLASGWMSNLGSQNEATRARGFQESVLKNKIQWAADDMEKAGFNRLLAVQGVGGGGAPGGAMASMQNPGAGFAGDKLKQKQGTAVDSQINATNAKAGESRAVAANQKALQGANEEQKRLIMENVAVASANRGNIEQATRLTEAQTRSAVANAEQEEIRMNHYRDHPDDRLWLDLLRAGGTAAAVGATGAGAVAAGKAWQNKGKEMDAGIKYNRDGSKRTGHTYTKSGVVSIKDPSKQGRKPYRGKLPGKHKHETVTEKYKKRKGKR